MSLMRANVMAANRAFERSMEDDASNRYWNDRRNPVFMPKSKHDHVSNGQTLKALLAEHGEMDMDEARERGLIIDADEYEDISGREDAQLEYDETEDHDEFDEDGRRLR